MELLETASCLAECETIVPSKERVDIVPSEGSDVTVPSESEESENLVPCEVAENLVTCSKYVLRAIFFLFTSFFALIVDAALKKRPV